MKIKTVFWTLIICALAFGGYQWYAHAQAVKLAKATEQKIDAALEQNTAILNGALDSFNTVIAQKDEKIKQLELADAEHVRREKQLLSQAAEQEANVKPILEQYPEVAALVFPLKETVAEVQADRDNLRGQVVEWHGKYDEAMILVGTYQSEILNLRTTLTDVRADLHKALSITGKKQPVWLTIAEWGWRGVITVAALK